MGVDGIHLLNVETLTPVGLYILLMLLMFFERVVPIGRLRAEQATTKYWRDVAEKKQATIDTQAETIGTQAETIGTQSETIHILAEGTGKTVEKVMTTIQEKARVDS